MRDEQRVGDNMDELYELYIYSNEENFRKNYSNSYMCNEVKYDKCMLDFVSITDGEYLVIDKEMRQACGMFTVESFKEVQTEKTVDSILFADEWDIRKAMPVIQQKKWAQVYFVLNQAIEKFASFFKLKNFFSTLPTNVKIFKNTEEMYQYFSTNHDVYLPRKIVGPQLEKYEVLFKELHDARIKRGVLSQNVFLSICIPTYNRGKFALRAVETALKCPYDAEIEIVVCDNGSTLDTEGYKEIEKIKDSRLRYYRSPQNGGYCANIINCLHKAKGRFVLFCSDEDSIIPENMGTALDWLRNHQDIGACVFSSGEDKEWAISCEETFEPGVDAVVRAYRMNYITSCCFNMNSIKQFGLLGRDAELKNNHFYVIYTHCAIASLLGLRLKIMNSDIILWRLGEQSTVSDCEKEGKLYCLDLPENRSLQMKDAIYLVQDSLSEQELQEIMKNYLSDYYSTLSSLYKNPRYSSAFIKRYRWLDVCTLHYKSCLCLLNELEAEEKIRDVPAFIAKMDKVTFNWLVCKRRQKVCTPEENLLPALQAQVAKYYYDKGTPFEQIDFEGIEKELTPWVQNFLKESNDTL